MIDRTLALALALAVAAAAAWSLSPERLLAERLDRPNAEPRLPCGVVAIDNVIAATQSERPRLERARYIAPCRSSRPTRL